VLATEIAVVRRDTPVAAALLSPYLAWTGFATALNAAVSEPTEA
jgi:tryptophan-rich sensory protein